MFGEVVTELHTEPLLVVSYPRHVHILGTREEVVDDEFLLALIQRIEVVLCGMLYPLAVIDVVRVGDMRDHLARRSVEYLHHLLFLGEGEMHEAVEGESFDTEASAQSPEGVVLLQHHRRLTPLLTGMGSAESGNARAQYYCFSRHF